MTDTTASLQRKIGSAGDLQSVVRTMKAMAASNIGQYEQAVRALGDYYRSVELGLSICFRESRTAAAVPEARAKPNARLFDAVVFGSDQGLVGRFNDEIADFAMKSLAALPGHHRVWAVGERVHARLMDAGVPLMGLFAVPNSVKAITPLVGAILTESDFRHKQGHVTELHLFYNRHTTGSNYAPIEYRLLPLDNAWRLKLIALRCPCLPAPGEHHARRNAIAPSDLRHLRPRRKRLFDDPRLVILRPAPPPLQSAQHLDPHRLMTLKLDLRSHASRNPPHQTRRRSSDAYRDRDISVNADGVPVALLLTGTVQPKIVIVPSLVVAWKNRISVRKAIRSAAYGPRTHAAKPAVVSAFLEASLLPDHDAWRDAAWLLK